MNKSGGVATNIGIHFFDMLQWLFGSVQQQAVHLSDPERMAGWLELENADVEWFLSVDRSDLPKEVVAASGTTYRSVEVDGDEVEFSGGFRDLHTVLYEQTLSGNGFGIDAARPAIELVHTIRNTQVNLNVGSVHPSVLGC